MTPRPLIIDCDPGQDDAVALLFAMASPEELDLQGITCVAGNVGVDLTTRNALRVCALAGRPEVPVLKGVPRPILRPLRTAPEVHGETGLDGVELPEPVPGAAAGHAVDFIIESCRAAGPDGLTLAPIGPMTNLALAIVMAPDIAANIREIVFMGGVARNPGNTTPSAEFNMFVDPHAARIVLEAGVATTMLGLDVTHKAITTPARRDAIRDLGNAVGAAVADMLTFYDRHDIERYGMPGGPLHDPCVIGYLLRPDLFEGRDCHVAVETESPVTIGETVVDWWGVSGQAANCRVVTEIDADGFYALLTERLGRYD